MAGANVVVDVDATVVDVVLDCESLVPLPLNDPFGLLGRGAGVVTGSMISSSRNTSSSTNSSIKGADVVVVDVVDIFGRLTRLFVVGF